MSKRSQSLLRAAVATLIAVALLPASATANASDDPDARVGTASSPRSGWSTEAYVFKPIRIGFDILILRPLGAAAVVVGAVAFVPVFLITAANGIDGIRSASETFVTEPAHDVFQRPLGDF